MLFAITLLLPWLLQSARSDRLTELVEKMRLLTLRGDHQALGGSLIPVVLEELVKPHPNASSAWNQVGLYFQTQGDYAAAERAYQRGMRLVQKEGKAGEPDLLLLLNLATLYLETRQHPVQADTLGRRALKQAIGFYGPASPELAKFLYILGSVRQRQSDRKGARRYFQEALDLAGDRPDGKLLQGYVRASLGILSASGGQWIDARESLIQSIAPIETYFGTSHPVAISAHLNLARVYAHLKQWPLANASLARAREITEARLGPDHRLMAEILATSASVLQKTGLRREARDLERRAKSIAAAQPKNSALQPSIDFVDLIQSGRR